MKKLSVLIALFMCVVIGGVYANWAYSASDDIQDKFLELSLGLTDASQTGANGEYTITSNAKYVIDQKVGSNHVAELRVESTDGEAPKLTVKFTPFDAASVTVKKSGVPTEIAFTTGSDFLYNIDNDGNYKADGTPTEVFIYANESNGEFEEENAVDWIKVDEDEDGFAEYFYVEYDATALLQQVKLSREFVLDTYLEYAQFQQSLLHAGNVIVKVSDGIGITNSANQNPAQQG